MSWIDLVLPIPERLSKLGTCFGSKRSQDASQDSTFGRTVFILKIWFAAEVLPAWLYGLLPWAAPLRFLPAALGIYFSPRRMNWKIERGYAKPGQGNLVGNGMPAMDKISGISIVLDSKKRFKIKRRSARQLTKGILVEEILI